MEEEEEEEEEEEAPGQNGASKEEYFTQMPFEGPNYSEVAFFQFNGPH